MSKIIIKNPIDPDTGIFHHDEGIGLRLANIHLDTMEVSLVNTIYSSGGCSPGFFR